MTLKCFFPDAIHCNSGWKHKGMSHIVHFTGVFAWHFLHLRCRLVGLSHTPGHLQLYTSAFLSVWTCFFTTKTLYTGTKRVRKKDAQKTHESERCSFSFTRCLDWLHINKSMTSYTPANWSSHWLKEFYITERL